VITALNVIAITAGVIGLAVIVAYFLGPWD
jgi:hypothetical protein